MPKIITYSKRLVDPFNLREEDICIEDIAKSLSQINRFNGHAPFPYSVAQHSIILSYRVGVSHALSALLHDAAEAYLGDIVRPIKKDLFYISEVPEFFQDRVQEFEAVERRVLYRINSKFGAEEFVPTKVKDADTQLTNDELTTFFGDKVPADQQGTEFSIPHMDPFEVEQLFLDRYAELTGGLSNAAS